MSTVRWELYPLVAASALPRAWLQLQSHLQLAPNTVDAYGRCLNDFLDFCQQSGIEPLAITRDQVALYVQDLAHRPNPKGVNMLSMESGRGLSNATMQQRITVLRRTLQHGDGYASNSPGIILSADILLVDEASSSAFWPHSTVDGFEGDQIGYAVALVHFAEQVRIGDEFVVGAGNATLGSLVRVGDPLDLGR